MTHHVVLFDGTASRPWNRMLFAPQSVALPRVIEPPPLPVEPKRLIKVADRLRRSIALRGIWFTALEGALAAGVSKEQASSALTNCVINGEIEADKSQHRHRYRFRVR